MDVNNWNDTFGTIDWGHDFEEDVMEKIEEFYYSGVDMNMKNSFGWTPLMYAADAGKRDATEMLIDFGADVNAQNKCGSTALHVAAWHGFMNIIKVLIDNNADVSIRNKIGSRATDLTTNKIIKEMLSDAMFRSSAVLSHEEDIQMSVFNRQYE